MPKKFYLFFYPLYSMKLGVYGGPLVLQLQSIDDEKRRTYNLHGSPYEKTPYIFLLFLLRARGRLAELISMTAH